MRMFSRLPQVLGDMPSFKPLRFTRIGEGGSGTGVGAGPFVEEFAGSATAGNETGVSERGHVMVGNALTNVVATLGAEASPSDLLGIEIFNFECAPGICAVR